MEICLEVEPELAEEMKSRNAGNAPFITRVTMCLADRELTWTFKAYPKVFIFGAPPTVIFELQEVTEPYGC